MSQEVLSEFWAQFKKDPWEDHWLFSSVEKAPDAPDVVLDLQSLEEFRAKVIKEPGPYGATRPEVMDGFLAMFLLPFIHKDQEAMAPLLASAITTANLRSIAIEALSIYFATGTPKRPQHKKATDKEQVLIREQLGRVVGALSLEETFNACTLATALGLRETIEEILDGLRRFSLHDQFRTRLALEGDGWLDPHGVLFESRQDVSQDKYLEIADRINAWR